jgi:hypothetical protein
VPKLNLSSLLEAFALAADVPQSAWQTVPCHRAAIPQPETRIQDMMLKSNTEYLDQALLRHTEGGSRDE